MAGAVVGRGYASMGTGDLHVQVRIADLLADHLTHPEGTEHRIGDNKGNLSAGCHACRHACRILLCNAHIKVLIRKFCPELPGLTGFSDIHIHHIDLIVFFPEFHDLFTKSVSGCLFYFAHLIRSCLSFYIRLICFPDIPALSHLIPHRLLFCSGCGRSPLLTNFDCRNSEKVSVPAWTCVTPALPAAHPAPSLPAHTARHWAPLRASRTDFP